MDMKLVTPSQIFINGKFFCTANTVEISRNSPKFKRSLLPDNPNINKEDFSGTIVNIIRNTRTKEEIKELEEEKKKGSYDEFFNRMVGAVDDPEAHLPIDISDI
jgi:hypothetical protein